MENIVIIGGGVAGKSVAGALAKHSCKVTLFTREKWPFYQRPQLSAALGDRKALLSLPKTDEEYVKHQTIVKILPESKQVVSESGEHFSYDKLVLATGSNSRVLAPFEGVRGVFALRTLSDALEITDSLEEPVAVLGGGLLGVECALALADRGVGVTLIEASDHILNRQLHAEAASRLKAQLSDRGVNVVDGFRFTEVCKEDGRITALKCGDRVVECSTLILSLGVIAETSLAADASLKVGRGIVVDKSCRSSDENIYAAGDCAEFEGATPSIVPVALQMARTVVSSITGGDAEYVQPALMTRLKSGDIDIISIGSVGGQCVSSPAGDGTVYRFVNDGVVSGVVLYRASSLLAKERGMIGKPLTLS